MASQALLQAVCVTAFLPAPLLFVHGFFRQGSNPTPTTGTRVPSSALEDTDASEPLLHQNTLYSDCDGTATEQSTLEAADVAVRVLLVVTSLLTLFSAAFRLYVIGTVTWEISLLLVGWVFVAAQSLRIASCLSPLHRFNLGLLGALSTVFLISGSLLEVIISTTKRHGIRNKTDLAYAVQFSLAVATLFCLLSLQRRPALFRNGRAVDAQYSVSVLSRYTLSWANSLFKTSRARGTLDDCDFPEVEEGTRSEYLLKRIKTSNSHYRPLWQRLILVHAWDIARQWVCCTLESAFMFVPQICLFRLLSLLEIRYATGQSDNELWFWAGALAVTNLMHLMVEIWTNWISWGILFIKTRAQLTAMVYDKSINQPDIKQLKKIKGDKSEPDGEVDPLAKLADETDPLLPKDSVESTIHRVEVADAGAHDDEDEDENELGESNLVGVDIERLGRFAAENIDFLGSVLKSLFGTIFLIKILGVWPTLAGFAVPIVFAGPSKLGQRGYHKANDKVMATRDKKTHIITEVLQGMRQIKFASMEEQWRSVVLKVRAEEIKHWWSLNLWGLFLITAWLAVPILVGATALSVYAWINQTLTPAVAFTALATLSSLEYTLSVIPAIITELLDAIVSLKRLDQHLSGPVRAEYVHDSTNISFEKATICWPSVESTPDRFLLRDMTIDFPQGLLSIVVGKTGAGKSLLLAGLAGEAQVVEGRIFAPILKQNNTTDSTILDRDWIMPSATAFVAQIPWIENASIKDNITYGLPMNRKRYLQVVEACALKQDLDALEDKDDTEVGTTGINISGGQRWRLTLARALYSRAGTLLLDDIFSAVDSHVGAHILKEAVLGPLCQGRTVIIATHHAGLVLPFAAMVVKLGEDGALESVERPGSSANQTQTENERHSASKASVSHLDFKAKTIPDDALPEDPEENGSLADNLTADDKDNSPRKFVEDEAREVGAVKFDLIKTYLKVSGGVSHWTLLFVTLAISAGLTLGRSLWVKIWTQNSEETSMFQDAYVQNSDKSVKFYLLVYIGISLLSVSLVAVKVLVVLLGVVRAGTRLYRDMTDRVFQANLRWIDTVPTGRILNRFVGDFALIDNEIGRDLVWGLNGVFVIVIIVVSALLVSGYMIGPIIVLFILSSFAASLFLTGARGIKRLESTSRSPIFDLITTTLSGLATIRTFGKIRHYVTKMTDLIDMRVRAQFYLQLLEMWLEVRQAILAAVFLASIVIFLVLSPGIDAALAGFVLSFALEFPSVTRDTISRYTDFELSMNATERVVEYTKIPIESTSGNDVAETWPEQGKIEVRDLEVAYAPGLETVLKGISFTIAAGERVGIVGRTGSGKSTFTLALFRFLEQRHGQVIIDGVDVATIPVRTLRSRLSIIPQDPVLFTGTLRSNLDPWGKYSDMVLLETLRRVHLIGGSTATSGTATPVNRIANVGSSTPSIASQSQRQSNIFTNLSHSISRGGLNLSQGQRQLVCLARAILTQPSVMVLDEATSAVDMATDALIQRSIREGFKDSTLLVIAHRLSTVMDFDKILVLGDGKVVEWGSPRELWADPEGAFRGMCDGSGESEKLRRGLEGT